MQEKLERLNNLIKGELVAHWQYEIATKAFIGPNQGYLVSQFDEHAKEEYDHYEKLMVALMARGGKPVLNLRDIIDTAVPTTIELASNVSEYLREFFQNAEDEAIKSYNEFLAYLGNSDQDLSDIISGIIADERDHELDMKRLTFDNSSVIYPEPAKSNDDKSEEFSTGKWEVASYNPRLAVESRTYRVIKSDLSEEHAKRYATKMNQVDNNFNVYYIARESNK